MGVGLALTYPMFLYEEGDGVWLTFLAAAFASGPRPILGWDWFSTMLLMSFSLLGANLSWGSAAFPSFALGAAGSVSGRSDVVDASVVTSKAAAEESQKVSQLLATTFARGIKCRPLAFTYLSVAWACL